MARLYIDHDVSRHLALLLRGSGHDASAAFDVGLASVHDGVQLMTAARQRRILVSHNWKDFRLLHRAWLHWTAEWRLAEEHAGILVAPQSVWTVDQMAQELSAFVATSPTAANTLYRWTRSGGWLPHS